MTVRHRASGRGTERNFVALDVETASADIGSICQLGIAHFSEGQLCHVESHLVQPRAPFAASHTALHGIGAKTVSNVPVWNEVYERVRRDLLGKVIVSHTLFDRKAIFQACCRCRSSMFSYIRWIDSCEVARRAWPDLDGYSLRTLARYLELPLRPHDAGEDARVAGQVYLLASRQIARRAERSSPERPD